MHLRFVLAALAAALAAASAARADYTFTFADASGNATNNFSISPSTNNMVSVEVFLTQTGGSTNLSQNGLQVGGVSLDFSSSAPFTISGAGQIAPNAAAGNNYNTSVNTASGTTTATLQEVFNTPVLPGGNPNGDTANSIYLGTFTFTGVSAGTALAVTALPDNSGNDNVDGLGNSLDSMIHNSSAVITVAAVPEPGPLYLTGLAVPVIGAGAWLRLRRRAQTAAA